MRRERQVRREAATSSEQESLIYRGLESLRDGTAREFMTPRVDVVALPEPVSYEDVARAVRRSGHSHFPVYEEDLDRLAGVLFVKDLFHLGPLGSVRVPSEEEVSRRLREPFLVPESRPALELLAEMRRLRRSFAVVVDEYGGVAGVLTVNDLVSELVGDIQDEHDSSSSQPIVRVDTTRWLVEGSVSVDDVRDGVGAPLPDGDYVTLGGYLLDALGRIPDEGDSVELEGWTFRVAEMDRRRVHKVVVQAPPTTMDADGAR